MPITTGIVGKDGQGYYDLLNDEDPIPKTLYQSAKGEVGAGILFDVSAYAGKIVEVEYETASDDAYWGVSKLTEREMMRTLDKFPWAIDFEEDPDLPPDLKGFTLRVIPWGKIYDAQYDPNRFTVLLDEDDKILKAGVG